METKASGTWRVLHNIKFTPPFISFTVLLKASRSLASNDLPSTYHTPGIALSHEDATEVISDPDDLRDL